MMQKKDQQVPALNIRSKDGSLERYVRAVISARRKSMGLSGKELGRRVGLSQQQISRYERGKTSITLSHLENLSVVLYMSFREFLDELFLYAKMSDIRAVSNRCTLPYLNYPDDILAETIAAEISDSALLFNKGQ